MKRIKLTNALTAVLAAAVLLGVNTLGAAAAEQDNAESDLPAAYSSRDLGYVTSVKVQQYNSCWVYASLATLESALLHDGYYTEDMSTNHLNIWATTHEDGTGWIRSVSTDGYPAIGIGYLTSWQGGVFQSDVADLPLSDSVSSDDIPTDLARYGVTSIRYLYKNDPETIKRCIRDHGGVYASYANSGSCWSTDKISYYYPPGYRGSYVGHSIEIVGWDDNYPLENFNAVSGMLPEHNGAWLAKNSWGNNNDLGGFFWISYEDMYVFSQKYNPSFSITGLEELDDTKKLMQNEIYGATYEFKYVPETNLTFLNHFQFDSDYDLIDKVMFKTESLGASYSIYFVPDGEDNTPDPDQSRWTKLYDGTVDYVGYQCADIEDFAYPGGAGSIAVTIDSTGTEKNSTIGVDEWLTASNDYVFINKAERGESYLMQDGQIQDLKDWYLEHEQDDLGGTFVIKAVTVRSNPVTLIGDANRDGMVNILDVTEIQRHTAEFITLKGTAKANADFNRDGVITIDDATAVQRFVAEFID